MFLGDFLLEVFHLLCRLTLHDLTVCRLLHLAIIHEASNYIKTMIDLSRNTEFLNVQNDQRLVCAAPESS